MFGYIKPFKPEMKVCEFDTFKAVYCGLCKQLSHVFGPFSSLTLSYDFTFMAVLSTALRSEFAGFKSCKCVANPLKKKTCLVPCDDLTISASTAMLMIYYKVKDDIADSGFFKRIASYCILPFASNARKRAAKIYPEIDSVIKKAMEKQAELEKSDNVSVDRAADPTASALGVIFEQLAVEEKQKKILNRLGYLVGRYVYFADALDDLDKDLKTNGFNPFLKKLQSEGKSLEEIKAYAVEVINLTIGEIAPAYELLSLFRYKEILDNIIYLGLHSEIKSVLNKERNEQSYE